MVKGCLNSARGDLENRVGTSCFDIEECEYSYNFMDNILKELDSKFFSKTLMIRGILLVGWDMV